MRIAGSMVVAEVEVLLCLAVGPVIANLAFAVSPIEDVRAIRPAVLRKAPPTCVVVSCVGLIGFVWCC